MVAANLKIIEDLKGFLHDVITHPLNRAFFTEKPTDFSRMRELPMVVVIAMIINFFKRSISIEIQEFFDIVVHRHVPTASAFCQQRQKLKPLFFQVWNGLLCEDFYKFYGAVPGAIKRWKGFTLLAVDGSTVYLPVKKELTSHFGTQDNQHVQIPMARVMKIYDVLNGITLWADIFPIRTSESAILYNHLHFPENSLLLLDRCFPSFALMYLLMNHSTHPYFVMRCKLGFNNEVKAFVRSRKPSKIVELHPTAKAKESFKEVGYEISGEEVIRVRLVKFRLRSGETEVLMTNLLDEGLYSVEELKGLYALRWKIETSYGTDKNQMQMEQFSGFGVICVQQDFHASIFVSNLQSLLEKQCKNHLEQINARRKYVYKINTNLSLAAMKHRIAKLFMQEDIVTLLEQLQEAFHRNVVPIRLDRQFKRKRKAKRYKSKYQTFTNYKRAI